MADDKFLTGDWQKALAMLRDFRKNLPQALQTALLQEAQEARTAIIQGIDSGAPGGQPFKPLSPNTLMVRRIQAAGSAMAAGRARAGRIGSRFGRDLARANARQTYGGSAAASGRVLRSMNRALTRSQWTTFGQAVGAGVRKVGGSKILIQSGALRNSITVVRRGRGQVFIGVLRSAMSRNGRKLYNIARIHEYGMGPVAIRWTPQSRRWWFAMLRQAGLAPKGGGKGLPGGMRLVRIPPRPFLRPTFRQLYGNWSKANALYCWRVVRLLQSHG